MGVPNSQNYTISKHANMRIQARFHVPATKVSGWVQRFLASAKFFRNSDNSKKDELQIFKKGEVLLVLNIEELVVVTAYSYNPFNKTDGLGTEILERLQSPLKQIIQEEQLALRDDLDGLMLDLQLSFQAYQTHPHSQKNLQEFTNELTKVNQRLEISKTLFNDIAELKS